MVTINEEGDACAYYFWAITLFFFVIALINLFVLLSIVAVLGIGPNGMESIEFLPDLESVKFMKALYASDITLGSGVIRYIFKISLNLFLVQYYPKVCRNFDEYNQLLSFNTVVTLVSRLTSTQLGERYFFK